MSMTNRKRQGLPLEQVHTTRMVPKRAEEILDGGSIFLPGSSPVSIW